MQNSKIELYIQNLLPPVDQQIRDMELYASEHQVPIMEKTAISVMLSILKLHQPHHILEIGTAIGYSAIRMVKSLPDAKVVTVERDQERYEEAIRNIQNAKLENKITTLYGDAFDLIEDIKKHGPYDVLFIDAAKGQYQRFFESFEPLLSVKAVIITDNVLFKGLVVEENIESKRIRSLVRKIKQYNEWLMNHPHYETTIIPVGDGVAVSIKRGERE
ncbi:O-methyltransferase [Bacillus sp. FJAT-47783]|uniref:O-methyltransferase n=1 Tax=Bacillus sp. FJAT-47783 TaxID=2922712 RepID=UPI001FAB8762|nr:O-methyltransferase [Bacillus sp. FJAT-47783]